MDGMVKEIVFRIDCKKVKTELTNIHKSLFARATPGI
jgi:hypothetical protein